VTSGEPFFQRNFNLNLKVFDYAILKVKESALYLMSVVLSATSKLFSQEAGSVAPFPPHPVSTPSWVFQERNKNAKSLGFELGASCVKSLYYIYHTIVYRIYQMFYQEKSIFNRAIYLSNIN